MKEIDGKYLTFLLEKEIYGISIKSVKEINAMMNITPVPNMPDYMKGVINLRGKIITVMDLRLRLGMEEKEYSERTCIIIVEVEGQKGKKKIGIVVDSVSEVSDIKSSELEDFEDDYSKVGDLFVEGIAKTKSKIIILLDITKIVNNIEIKNEEVQGVL
ncbi:MAG: purine-binding chemotaxis protein CheW [Fusobacteriaceae bacterium]|nr:purine-binding chemotaxis protein CheW [Fusobacteriaceae bacterium]MBN2837685.1 purine-binding chemotaxis protein CheW [Fusobacteriaceae bacterium]